MPLVQTRGAASAQGFGEFAQVTAVNYIEDVFSTYLYTGTGASRTIVNNIDLATYGGLIWIKDRTTLTNHCLVDTVQGITKNLVSNTTAAAATVASGDDITSFTTTGWTFGNNNLNINNNGDKFASWTFRKQPKFFDVVTYSGNSVSGRLISQSLGSAPGCIIVKCTNLAGTNWAVWHRSLATGYTLQLQGTNAAFNTKPQWFNSSTQGSSTTFEVGSDTDTNETGNTYVAYLFAHDAGGFGLTGTDNVISCGSFTTNGSGVATVNLGYEPQFVLFKRTDSAGQSWEIIDTMRGFSVNSNGTSGNVQRLSANSSGAETNSSAFEMYLTSTGFATNQYFYNATYIYIAIRRGPMKVPTLGTSVFEPAAYTGNGTDPRTVGTLQVTDLAINMNRSGAGDVPLWIDRLRGPEVYLRSSGTGAESSGLTGWLLGQSGQTINGVRNTSPTTYIDWLLRRAPSFFDEVCYTGNGTGGRTVTHNLTVAPEIIIAKNRSAPANPWLVFTQPTGNSGVLVLNATDALVTPYFNWTPTSTTFSVGAQGFASNDSGVTYVAYLFATCAGVSKVGSYTGTAATLQIDCGFTAGARFVLIKRTDSTGDWYVWDSARGIIAGNDPYLLLNSTAAEVTNTDYVDTYSAGFEISSTAPAAINANGGSFIFLAIS